MNLTKQLTSKSDFFYKKKDLPTIKVGDKIKVLNYLELPSSEEEIAKDKKKKKERLQLYEGVVISRHEKKITVNSTITVRKMFQGGGVEKVFLLNSPWIKTITVTSSAKIKRGKLYYLRKRTGKSARLKQRFLKNNELNENEFTGVIKNSA
jgi:large subunit ribosomal protein L19